jgi:short-subunit dehydrogenase
MSQQYKVVITGASGGIGREIVKRLDKKAELIILVGLIKDPLENLKKELQTKRIFIVEGDINNHIFESKLKCLLNVRGY